ncbi:MAG: outer membrane beta-barrel protein [Alphaproteobacteria bacterium]
MSRVLNRAVAVAALSTGMCLIAGDFMGTAYAQGTGGGNPSGAGSTFLREPLSNQSVARRSRPEYDALGLRLGSFTLFPSVEAGIGFDSNVFQANDEESDFFYGIAPRVTLVSNWSRHQVVATAGARSRFLFEEASENTTDPDISIQGRLDVGPQNNRPGSSAFRFFAGARTQHEGRGEPEALIAAAERIQFDTYSAGARWDSQLNRIRYGIGAEVDVLRFEESEVPVGSAADGQDVNFGGVANDGVLNNDDRNQTIVRVSGEIGYDFSPGYVAFVRGEYNTRSFEEAVDRTGSNRDSDGYQVVAGARLELTNVLVGEVFGGYLEQRYDAANLADVDGVVYGAELEWYPSPLLTARVTADRQVVDTIVQVPLGGGAFANTSGRFDSNVGVGVDYEAARNIIISGDAAYRDSNFEGTNREDEVFTGGVSGNFLINRSARAQLGYVYNSRESNQPNETFSQHQIGFNVLLQR